MIKLERASKPVELTATLQADLTAEYKLTKKSVWNLGFLKKALRDFSFDKCCYCEANINEESKYLEVEHYHPKNPYENEVMEWLNLLPACKKCNGKKSDHDTKIEPIIDPTLIIPNKHLKLWHYRIKAEDDLGKMTISVLDLNNQDRLVKKRFEIGSAIQTQLEKVNDLLEDYSNGVQTTTRRKNSILNSLKALMREGLPTAEYAATSATVILEDFEYKSIKVELTSLGLWDTELSDLENNLDRIAFKLFNS